MRTSTDIEIPITRLLLPLVSYLIWTVFAVVWWSTGTRLETGALSLLMSGLGILGLAASSAASYVIFTLVNRANEHFTRTRALLWRALGSLEARATVSGQQALLTLDSAEESLYKLTQGERDRSAVLWALLSVIPFVGWIFMTVALWRLSRDLAKHSRLEGLVFEDADRSLRSVGTQGIPVRQAPIRSHDSLGLIVIILLIVEFSSAFFLGLGGSLILIYLTIGAFSLYWIDLSIRDPIDHFRYHSQLEGDMLQALPHPADDGTGGA